LLEIEISRIEPFRNLVKALSDIVKKGFLNIDEGKIQLRAMDPNHVAMVDFELPREFFDRYLCEGEPRISIRIGEFLKFLNRVEKDEQLTIKLDEEQLRLVIQCRRGGHIRRFKIPVLEPLEEEISRPKIIFKASARILPQADRQGRSPC
jgi:proliferating cell nuclear antigen